jgi:mRNA deadenylase 3'-5' endonuclease subunit Ccr4
MGCRRKCGTLDYIFYDSKSALHLIDTLSLPSKELQEPVSWPTNQIPSDHLMIGATFELKNESDNESDNESKL